MVCIGRLNTWWCVNKLFFTPHNQILLLFIATTESAIARPSLVCSSLLLISRHPLYFHRHDWPPCVPTAENHPPAIIDSHVFTHLSCKTCCLDVTHTQTHPCSVASGFYGSVRHLCVWDTLIQTHTHANCKYSCWCLRLVAALQLAHICSSIDPPVLCTSRLCVCDRASECTRHTI